MWNFIKGVFKFFFALTFFTTLVVGAGAAVLAYVFKKDFEEIESKTKEIVSDIENNIG
ncbi:MULTISPECIES: hypothetical protein [unclassified Staphylococcus]|uniref:hypothetical protein n=1 Tax=unclassified Staphylococcus TaxID=91994 RepID=UPI0021D20546|nr:MULTISPECIES: hypothetical protein [unclassified Staphylococcus]UXR69041.1 hypothetical protein MUA26_07780 [Staphylococcus sp. IVB6246]UXR71091.1 hypothetical protein MUA88_07825 [Staphylococcus sp. IVB6240]UXR73386.1 hypothetical protein MUA48_08400 [Staphylococcus sp. IVB6238]UXR75681.1 hypothetical protein MUA74_08400 [Staphylococcus sp. IVB6233]UXR79879.1 hypothetical protein MUA65_07995 [Staphylococcus sp. IVB6218]